jgi:adenine-specific DNA-methyltransferase
VRVFREDANVLVREVEETDVAYLDPPYNQHPYGSNYFMLNLITHYKRPRKTSPVSGIPLDWNRSDYNKRGGAERALSKLVEHIKAKYLLVSFNSEGFISVEGMKALLGRVGRVEILETSYNTFRGGRNLRNREIYVREYLYLVEKF